MYEQGLQVVLLCVFVMIVVVAVCADRYDSKLIAPAVCKLLRDATINRASLSDRIILLHIALRRRIRVFMKK